MALQLLVVAFRSLCVGLRHRGKAHLLLAPGLGIAAAKPRKGNEGSMPLARAARTLTRGDHARPEEAYPALKRRGRHMLAEVEFL